MGILLLLLLVFSLLMILDSIAFIYGVKKRSWTACIITTVIMAGGIGILAYLWIKSPM